VPDQQARSLYHLAAITTCEGRSEDALRILEAGLAVARDSELRTDLSSGIGTIAIMMGDYRKAVACLEEDRKSIVFTDEKEGYLIGLSNLAYAYFYIGRYADALRLLDESIRLVEDAPVIETVVTWALVLERLGDYEGAIAQLDVALERSRTKNARWQEAHALGLLGRVQERQGHDAEALVTLERALAMHLEFDSRAGEADVRLWLGVLHLRSGRFDEAADSHREALAIAEATSLRGRKNEALAGLGALAHARGENTAAAEYYIQALTVAEATGDPFWLAKAHEGLGDSYRALGDASLADDHTRQALAEYTRLGVPEAGELRERRG
jgi:tetratricopeptide (TPR) repeat protein